MICSVWPSFTCAQRELGHAEIHLEGIERLQVHDVLAFLHVVAHAHLAQAHRARRTGARIAILLTRAFISSASASATLTLFSSLVQRLARDEALVAQVDGALVLRAARGREVRPGAVEVRLLHRVIEAYQHVDPRRRARPRERAKSAIRPATSGRITTVSSERRLPTALSDWGSFMIATLRGFDHDAWRRRSVAAGGRGTGLLWRAGPRTCRPSSEPPDTTKMAPRMPTAASSFCMAVIIGGRANANPWLRLENFDVYGGLLGGDVRDQLALKHEDLVLQHQLAFLEALRAATRHAGVVFEGFDGSVEIAVLQVELADAPLDLLGTFQRHGGHGRDLRRGSGHNNPLAAGMQMGFNARSNNYKFFGARRDEFPPKRFRRHQPDQHDGPGLRETRSCPHLPRNAIRATRRPMLDRAFDDMVAPLPRCVSRLRGVRYGIPRPPALLEVTLAMARLLDGYEHSRGDGPEIGERLFQLGVVCALYHDIGYIRRANDTKHVSGAEYTPIHVSRGGRFLKDYLPQIGMEDFAEVAGAVLHFTGYEVPVAQIKVPHPIFRLIGSLLGSADIVAQMADRCYLEKCRDRLYPEFVAGGITGAAHRSRRRGSRVRIGAKTSCARRRASSRTRLAPPRRRAGRHAPGTRSTTLAARTSTWRRCSRTSASWSSSSAAARDRAAAPAAGDLRQRLTRQFTVAPVSRTTFPQRSSSALHAGVAKSSGELVATSTPAEAISFLASGVERIFVIEVFSLSTISRGVPAGASRLSQIVAS